MATSIREGLLGKENSLPHQPNPAHHRASLNPYPSPSRPIGAKSASLSDKSVSRYVRPRRSRSDVYQPTKPPAAKKPEVVASSNKASFARRRSLVKNSPPVSQSPRIRQSPNPKETSTHAVQKATSNRIVKTTAKDVDQKQSLSDTSVSSCVRPRRSKQPTKPAAAKKTAAAAASNKSSSARLRSLVKDSPPASQSPSTRQSPNPKEKRMHTSSTFSRPRSSGTTLQKATSNRIVKTASKDVVKKQSLSARPLSLKKNDNVTNKQNSRSSKASSRTATVISKRLEGPETVNVPHPQENDLQSTVTDEEVSTNAMSNHVTSEQVPLDAMSNHENPASEVDNQDVGEGSMKAEEAEDQTPSKETNNTHLESQQLQEQLQDNSTNSINENLEVQAEDQGKEEVKEASKDSMKKEEAEVQNKPGKKPCSFHLEFQQLQEQLEYNSTDPVNENFEVLEDQGKEEVKDATEPKKVGNLSKTKEMKNIASPEPEPERQSKPEPAISPASTPEDEQTVARKRAIPEQRRKELIAVSNDMIEETASKLQEQRKNRVRALAGAFETVISRHVK